MIDDLPSFLLQDRDIKNLYFSYLDLRSSVDVAYRELTGESTKDAQVVKITKKILSPPTLRIIRSMILICDSIDGLFDEREWVNEIESNTTWIDDILPLKYSFEDLLDRLESYEIVDKKNDLKKKLSEFARKYVLNINQVSDRTLFIKGLTTALSMSYNIEEFTHQTLYSATEEFIESMPMVGYGLVSVNMFKVMLVKNAYYSSYLLTISEPSKKKESEEEEVDITALITSR